MLTALAMVTARVRLGHMVVCTGFRNPALTAKMSSTHRRDLGRSVRARHRCRLEGGGVAGLRLRLPVDRRTIGGPARPPRGDHPDVRPGPGDVPWRVRAASPGRSTAQGYPVAAHPDHRRRQRASASPGASPSRSPTSSTSSSWRRRDVAAAIPDIRARCEAEGRDPATLKISLYTRDDDVRVAGQPRVDFLGTLQELGLEPGHLLPRPMVDRTRGPGSVRRGLPGRRRGDGRADAATDAADAARA